MSTRGTVALLVTVVLSLPGLIHCFQPFFADDQTSITHRVITQSAILRKTAEVCRDIVESEGRDFSLNVRSYLSMLVLLSGQGSNCIDLIQDVKHVSDSGSAG